MTTKSEFTHAAMVPLIGGEALGSEAAFGRRPEYIMSFKPFAKHDAHLLNWYENEVPYHVLDDGAKHGGQVDVVSSVCPCAGLSSLSTKYSSDNETNEWMITCAEYVLGEVKPKVYWGENSPNLAGNVGAKFRARLFQVGRQHGYSMSLYRTKSLLHGMSQVRERAFYFFWEGDKIPLLEYYSRPYERIENTILNARGNSLQEPINSRRPTENPYYRYVLEVVAGGKTHRDFCSTIETRVKDILTYIEEAGHDWGDVATWMDAHGYENRANHCRYFKEKVDNGMGFMKRENIIPRDHIGAFVGHYPLMLMHPIEDRYITYREAMTIMGMPQSFELLDPKKNYNHICQNVPVPTATDIATEVRAALEGRRSFIDSVYALQFNHDQSYRVNDPCLTQIATEAAQPEHSLVNFIQ